MQYFITIFKLGLCNVAYVAWYKFSLKTGIRKIWFPRKEIHVEGSFFFPSAQRANFPVEWKKPLLEDAEKIVNGYLRYYAFHWKKTGSPPDWFLNPFNGNKYPDTNRHWTALPDFHPAAGDIKNVWEPSRFEWVVTLARAYAVTGDDRYLNILNNWLADWCRANPLNTGPNWKCGQEASIRMFNLLNAAVVLNQWAKPFTELSRLVYLHLERIAGNIRYAIAQDNNHGTSEAAALFIGGSWLEKTASNSFSKASTYAKKGRHWLENRVKKLIAEDGSFSQHSVTYHRVLLDTLCFAETWSQTLNLTPFSNAFYNKAKAATKWLWMLTDEQSGDAPNLGANDGALFLNLHSCDYRNFRPTIQLSYALFFGGRRYDSGEHDEAIYWLNIDLESLPVSNGVRQSAILDNSYGVFIGPDSWALIRLPQFRFRPSHNDVFHFDLWHQGKNILCDAGSFSYNPGNDSTQDFKSVKVHNTASFDEQEQMQKLSRFLLGSWIKESKDSLLNAAGSNGSWKGSYQDANNNFHKRNIAWNNNTWMIEDWFQGAFSKAEIGFNLMDEGCSLNGNHVYTSWGQIEIQGAHNVSLEPVSISKYYMQKSAISRLVIEADNNNHIITTIELKQ